MKTVRIAHFLLIPLVLLLALAPLSTRVVSAATLNPPPPDGFTCTTNGSGTVCETTFQFTEDRTSFECGFPARLQSMGPVRDTLYYDQSGTLVRETIKPIHVVTIIASPYLTNTIVHAGQTVITYNADGTLTIVTTGTLNGGGVSTYPHFGVLVGNAGRTVGLFDPVTGTFISESQHGLSIPFDLATFCKAVGPNP